MAGYNIVCDPGDLYTRKCYVLNPTTGAREEIIGYTAGGDPISKAPTTAAGTAWQPTVTTLDLSGNAELATPLRCHCCRDGCWYSDLDGVRCRHDGCHGYLVDLHGGTCP